MCEGKVHKWGRMKKSASRVFWMLSFGPLHQRSEHTPDHFHFFCYHEHRIGGNQHINNEVLKMTVTSCRNRRQVSLKKISKIQLLYIYACLNKYGSYVIDQEMGSRSGGMGSRNGISMWDLEINFLLKNFISFIFNFQTGFIWNMTLYVPKNAIFWYLESN